MPVYVLSHDDAQFLYHSITVFSPNLIYAFGVHRPAVLEAARQYMSWGGGGKQKGFAPSRAAYIQISDAAARNELQTKTLWLANRAVSYGPRSLAHQIVVWLWRRLFLLHISKDRTTIGHCKLDGLLQVWKALHIDKHIQLCKVKL